MTRPQDISIDNYDYPLPDSRIAKHPLQQRDACKLLVCKGDKVSDTVFSQIPELLPPDSYLIYNNTRVINARLRFRKGEDNTGALIEIFCLEPVEPADYAVSFASERTCSWLCFVGNSKRWKDGALKMPLVIDGQPITLTATRLTRQDNASTVAFEWDGGVTFSQIIATAGEIPIPPYLNRGTEDSDNSDYQTVFSHIEGSVAAPTAGLHFTDTLLDRISQLGIKRRELTLHVGAGTFQPVKTDNIGEHLMHSEFIAVPKALIEELASADKPIIAVGTTSVRTLESLYHIGCLMSQDRWNGEVPQWYPYQSGHPDIPTKEALQAIVHYLQEQGLSTLLGSTRIIIAPGYKYRVVDGMVTNFHQPKSTLLLLVSAYIGDRWRELYDYALDHGFRFLSYGDAMLLL